MRQTGSTLRLSATDLANHLACHHLSHLDLAVARGERRPPDFYRPDVAILRERGDEHERAFLSHLEGQGLRIARPGDDLDENVGFERTLSAMREGADVIVQATLLDGRWFGRADVLRRVPRPSRLGAWSYEVWDTKLARETKGGSVLQICLYSDLLETIQGARPERMYIVPPRDDFKPDEYRVDDFMAYYRVVRRRLEAAIGAAPATGGGVSPRAREDQAHLPLFAEPAVMTAPTYPEPVPHCDICRWWPVCDGQRRRDDHLSFVAGISRLQTRELQARQLTTLEALASEPLPLSWKPARGSVEAYTRVREQARVQRDGRKAGRALYELLPQQPGLGFERLPAPSPGARSRRGAIGVRGVRRFRHGALGATPRSPHLSLRPLRAGGDQASDGPPRDARERGRPHVARRAVRRSPCGRQAGAAGERRGVLHQEARGAVRLQAGGRSRRRRREPSRRTARPRAGRAGRHRRRGPAGRRDLQPRRLRVRLVAVPLARGCARRPGGEGDIPRAASDRGRPAERGGRRKGPRGPPDHGRAARRRSVRTRRAHRRAAGEVAFGLHARVAPPRGEGGVVGVLPPPRAVRRGIARREIGALGSAVRRAGRSRQEQDGAQIPLPDPGDQHPPRRPAEASAPL